MNTTSIKFSETGQFSSIFLDYISGSDKLKPFYTHTPTLASFNKAIANKSAEKIDRNILSTVLTDQYKHINEVSGKVSQNIQALKDGKTFTVCTGHQLCLFTGPLYFIYKIITTINLSEKLKSEYPQYNFIPVYWMATDDHDFEEINHAYLVGKKIEWKKEIAYKNDTKQQLAAGSLNTTSLRELIDELKTLIGETSEAKKITSLLNDSYLKNKNLADATRHFVNSLFGEYGLVIVDGNDVKLKPLFTEIIKDDLQNNSGFKLVNQSIEKLKISGYSNQVNPREVNSFLLIDGKRERIIIENGYFNSTLLNNKISLPDLVKKADDSPAEFSPNVVLRPLYQQKILPNLAYVGGPGEIAYWLEYKSLFDHYKIELPVLMPRNFAMVVDTKSQHLIEKLEITTADLFKTEDQLIKEVILKHSGKELNLDAEKNEIEKVYTNLTRKAEAIDSTLKATVQAELQKLLKGLNNIEGKLLKATKQKNEHTVGQIKKLKEKLLPNNVLQERHDNFIPYQIRSEKFIDELKIKFNPFSFEFLILLEK